MSYLAGAVAPFMAGAILGASNQTVVFALSGIYVVSRIKDKAIIFKIIEHELFFVLPIGCFFISNVFLTSLNLLIFSVLAYDHCNYSACRSKEGLKTEEPHDHVQIIHT